MVMVKLPKTKSGQPEVECYYDATLLKQEDSKKRAVETRGFDMPFIVSGLEGGGKSVLSFQLARYLWNDFTLDNVHFDYASLRANIQTAPKHSCLVIDESYRMISNREVMSRDSREVVKMLNEVRQRELYLIFVVPSPFLLDKYLTLWRARCLINVYLGPNLERGYFSFYSQKRLRQMMLKGRKEMTMEYVRPDFRGRFTNTYVVDKEEYLKKKSASFEEFGKDQVPSLQVEEHRRQFLALITGLYRSKESTWQKMAETIIQHKGVDHSDARRLSNALRMASGKWARAQARPVEKVSEQPLDDVDNVGSHVEDGGVV